MPYVKPVVGFVVRHRILPQRHLQQLLPQLALDGDSRMVAVFAVRVHKQSIGGAERIRVKPEVPGQIALGGADVGRRRGYDAVQVFAQARRLLRLVEDVMVVSGQRQRIVADASDKVVDAIRKNPVLNARPRFYHRSDVAVKLVNIALIDAPRLNDVPLELDAGVVDV